MDTTARKRYLHISRSTAWMENIGFVASVGPFVRLVS